MSGSVETAIREKLTAAFTPQALEIANESDRHAGHAGSPQTGESHFTVLIRADAFAGLNRVERQRAVYAVLKDELDGPVHALSVMAKAPGEA